MGAEGHGVGDLAADGGEFDALDEVGGGGGGGEGA